MGRFYDSAVVIVILCLGLMLGCGEDSWTKKGKEFLAAGDYKSATWYFQQAIDAKPTNAEAHYQLGLVYRQSGQYDSAIESFRTAAKLAPERMDVQLALGETYMKMGHRKLAYRLFLKVIQNSDSNDVLQTIAHLTGGIYNTTRLTPDYVRTYGPSAAAGRITFTAYVDDNNEIYVIDIDGKNKKRLTFNDTNDYSPCLSPDGTKIVYISFMRWRNSNDEIHIMDIDGKNQTRLTFNVHSDGNPAFSPDGKLIAFESNRDGNSEIYIMDVDGKNQRRLTFTSQMQSAVSRSRPLLLAETEAKLNARCFSPSFSPDGKKIVFASYFIESSEEKVSSSNPTDLKQSIPKEVEGYNVVSQIYVMDVDGKNLKQLTNVKAINSNPSFSPDGKKIVFDSNRNTQGVNEFGESNSCIYIMDVDGKNQIRLTGDEYVSMEPVFTPDGKRIIFSGLRSKPLSSRLSSLSTETERTGQKLDSDNLGIYIMDFEQPITKEYLIKRLK